jgi:hypothetical protein
MLHNIHVMCVAGVNQPLWSCYNYTECKSDITVCTVRSVVVCNCYHVSQQTSLRQGPMLATFVVCECVRVCTRARVCVRVYMRVCVCTHAYVCVYARVCVRARVCVCDYML